MTTRQGVPLRFATFLAPNMLPVYRFLAERIARRVGCPVELVVGTSFDQFERGDVDLGVICGLPYVWLAARHPAPVEPLAAPVLVGERYAGRPVYYSDVIVHRDSSITHLEDLHDRSWAYSDHASRSGHTVTLYTLVCMGARPGFFARVVEAGFHQRAIRLVEAGAVDAAAIDSQGSAVSNSEWRTRIRWVVVHPHYYWTATVPGYRRSSTSRDSVLMEFSWWSP